MRNGTSGLDLIFDKYGIFRETSRWKSDNKSQVNTLPDKIQFNEWSFQVMEEYLKLPRGDGRTIIASELHKIKINHPAIRKLQDLIEEVSQGRLEWDEYRSEMLPMVKAILNEIESRNEKTNH